MAYSFNYKLEDYNNTFNYNSSYRTIHNNSFNSSIHKMTTIVHSSTTISIASYCKMTTVQFQLQVRLLQ